MEFTLVYEGQLKSNGDPKHKHAIRTQFHPQLRKLWSLKLSHWNTQGYHSPLTPVFYPGPPRVEMMANNFSRCGYRFVPLVLAYCALACRIDILFLRRDNGRGAIVQGGDIDNRLKTLFDGMRIPTDKELQGIVPGVNEDPFYCLLEDDRLITEVGVTTDTLLTPETEDEPQNTVKLIIGIKLRPLQLNQNNVDFA